jgi:hypothetical protein
MKNLKCRSKSWSGTRRKIQIRLLITKARTIVSLHQIALLNSFLTWKNCWPSCIIICMHQSKRSKIFIDDSLPNKWLGNNKEKKFKLNKKKGRQEMCHSWHREKNTATFFLEKEKQFVCFVFFFFFFYERVYVLSIKVNVFLLSHRSVLLFAPNLDDFIFG